MIMDLNPHAEWPFHNECLTLLRPAAVRLAEHQCHVVQEEKIKEMIGNFQKFHSAFMDEYR
jgi:spermidine synthase